MEVTETRPGALEPEAETRETQILRLYIAGQTPRSERVLVGLDVRPAP